MGGMNAKAFAGLVSLIFFASAATVVWAADTKGEKPAANKKEPIKVTSDLLEAFNEKRLVVFSGNAVAIQGDKVIRADRLLLYYKKKSGGESKAKETKDIDQAGDLERMEAKGHVNVTQGNRVATGDNAVYEQDAQKIIMTGNAIMREGKNVIRGTKITLLMDENRGIVEGQEKRRVTATIYPSENKEGKDSKGTKEIKETKGAKDTKETAREAKEDAKGVKEGKDSSK